MYNSHPDNYDSIYLIIAKVNNYPFKGVHQKLIKVRKFIWNKNFSLIRSLYEDGKHFTGK